MEIATKGIVMVAMTTVWVLGWLRGTAQLQHSFHRFDEHVKLLLETTITQNTYLKLSDRDRDNFSFWGPLGVLLFDPTTKNQIYKNNQLHYILTKCLAVLSTFAVEELKSLPGSNWVKWVCVCHRDREAPNQMVNRKTFIIKILSVLMIPDKGPYPTNHWLAARGGSPRLGTIKPDNP